MALPDPPLSQGLHRLDGSSPEISGQLSDGVDDPNTIPAGSDVVQGLGSETEPRVDPAKQKIELGKYNTSLVFEAGENIVRSRITFLAGTFNAANFEQDMDLLNEDRSLIHTGKLLRQPDTGFGWSGWTELLVLLFDNYRRGLDIGSFPSLAHESPPSCYDETQGEERSHEIPSVSTSKSRSILKRTMDSHICR